MKTKLLPRILTTIPWHRLFTLAVACSPPRCRLGRCHQPDVEGRGAVKETYDTTSICRTTRPSGQRGRGAGGRVAARGGQQRLVRHHVTPQGRPRLQTRRRLQYSAGLRAGDRRFTTRRRTRITSRIAARSISTAPVKDASWELLNAATYIQGSRRGRPLRRPDDIPGHRRHPAARPPRRLHLHQQLPADPDRWELVHPPGGVESTIHDFLTDQRYHRPRPSYSYENYIDRQEVNGGVDIGYEVGKNTYLVPGFRYGRQDQFNAARRQRHNHLQPLRQLLYRILVGVEGSPASWLKLAVLAGPDIREFDARHTRRLQPEQTARIIGTPRSPCCRTRTTPSRSNPRATSSPPLPASACIRTSRPTWPGGTNSTTISAPARIHALRWRLGTARESRRLDLHAQRRP